MKKKKKIFWSKTAICLSLGLHKVCPSYRRSLQLSKEAIQHLNMNFYKFFLLLWVIFALLDPDPLTRLNPDPIRIRIRNPAKNVSIFNPIKIVSELSEIWSGIFIPDPGFGSRFFPHPGSWIRIPVPGSKKHFIQGPKKHRLPNPDPQHCKNGPESFADSVRTLEESAKLPALFKI